MPLGLFGSRKKVELEVTTDREAYRPGETVRVAVGVRGGGELAAAGGRVELVLASRRELRFESWDSLNDRPRQETGSQSDERVVATRAVAGPVRLGAGGADRPTVELTVPGRAPASGDGDVTRIAWWVRAVVDVRRGPDVEGIGLMEVLAPEALHAERASLPQEGPVAGFRLVLDVPRRSVRAGTPVRGEMTVRPPEDLRAEEVRIELVRVEEVPEGKGRRAERVVGARALAGAGLFAAGEARAFPFELGVPARAYPCHRTAETSVRWLVRGVVEVEGRPGRYGASLDLNVYNAD